MQLKPFPVVLRKMWSGSEVQDWINNNIRSVIMSSELDNSLSIEAYNEAITYTLECNDGYGLDFLESWQQGNWIEIQENFSDFDLTTQAQQHLIKLSGGMPAN